MGRMRKLAAVYLLALAAVVAFHFVFNSFYRDALGAIDVWAVLDWPIALGTLLALAINYRRLRTRERNGAHATMRECLETGTAFYATVLLALWFFSNWFNFLAVGVEGEATVNAVVWALVDPLVVLVFAATGRGLWREGSRS